jgi:cyclic pyranopterin phosphate synthase
MKRPRRRSEPASPGSTHFDAQGRARMVDVGQKEVRAREAVARGRVELSAEALEVVRSGKAEKGDVLGVARIAGIQAAKRTSEWIPLCHPLPLDALEIDFALEAQPPSIAIEARARTTARTGVEMEALVAVSAAALAIYDMCKSIDRGMVVGAIRLVQKTGGKSGTYRRPGE